MRTLAFHEGWELRWSGWRPSVMQELIVMRALARLRESLDQWDYRLEAT